MQTVSWQFSSGHRNDLLTSSECNALKDYAVNGILAKAENCRLEEKLQSAQKNATVWKQRFDEWRKHDAFMDEPDYGYIDIESCFNPIFEPLLETLKSGF